MDTKIERRLGLNNVLKRLAFYYVTKGFGSHPILDNYAHLYDEVVVRELYDFQITDKLAGAGGITVEFKMLGRRVRWIEFSITAMGGGGDEVIREVT